MVKQNKKPNIICKNIFSNKSSNDRKIAFNNALIKIIDSQLKKIAQD